MKILMATTFYPPFSFGGDGIFVAALAETLAAAGHEVHVVHCLDAHAVRAGPAPRELPLEDDIRGVRVHRLRSRLGPISPILTQQLGHPVLKTGRLKRILDLGFEIVNFHNISLIGGPGILRFGGDALRLYTLHEHWWVCPTHALWRWTGELCERPQCFRCTLAHGIPPQPWRLIDGFRTRCMKSVDALLAPSRFTADRHIAWLESHGVSVPVEMVLGFSSPFTSRGETRTDLPDRYFLYSGRLAPEKGPLQLVDALRSRPDLHLVMVGGGVLEEVLRRRNSSNLTLLGTLPRESLASLYAGALAVIVPSVGAESFGLSAVEAMREGTPVITRRCGGTEEVVAPDAGLVYSTDQELVAHMDRIANDADLRERLGAAGRVKAAATYSPEAYVQRWLGVVERAYERRRSRSKRHQP